ncbi:MAG: hypothetical protein AAB664_03790 [Patescibacteria group bacterium]
MDPISVNKKEQKKDALTSLEVDLVEKTSASETLPTVEVLESVKEEERSEEVGSQEVVSEQQTESQEEQIVSEPSVPASAPIQRPAPVKNKFEAEIEEVLQADLTDLYLSMAPEARKAFKQKGEETVSLIHVLVREAHINTKKILQLIRSWLQMIPGVNRFFLEQEAKIKTDKVLFVTEEEKRRGSKDLL